MYYLYNLLPTSSRIKTNLSGSCSSLCAVVPTGTLIAVVPSISTVPVPFEARVSEMLVSVPLAAKATAPFAAALVRSKSFLHLQ